MRVSQRVSVFKESTEFETMIMMMVMVATSAPVCVCIDWVGIVDKKLFSTVILIRYYVPTDDDDDIRTAAAE